MGVQLGFMGVQLGGKVIWAGLPGLRLRCGDRRAAAGGCHCASLMIERRAAAAAVRPCVRPGPGSPSSSFPQVTCLGRSGGPVLPPLFACEMRARPALAVLAWGGDGSPVWGCTTTSGDQVPPRTLFRFVATSVDFHFPGVPDEPRRRRPALEQPPEVIDGEARVPQDVPQRPGADVTTRVNRNGRSPAVRMTHDVWLPLILPTTNPAFSSAFTTWLPRTAGTGGIRLHRGR